MKERIKKIIPKQILELRRSFLNKKESVILKRLIDRQSRRHQLTLKNLQGKEKYRVAFFATHSSVWKYDYLYRLMEEHPRFYPIIVVCPIVNYGYDNMLYEMEKSYKLFKSYNYNVVRSYNEESKEYLDIKEEIAPDIIFYTNPYQGLIDERYYIYNFPDILTCYAPYGYSMSNNENALFNLPFHNLLWKIFCESDIHKNLAQRYALNKGVNVVSSGYLLFDEFDYFRRMCNNNQHYRKIIIWAPHHTIENNSSILGYSCFLELYNFFLELREIYKDTIYWVFKPHPILKEKLYIHPLWGKSKTDEYYENWSSSNNSELNEGNYTEIFLNSDAMILDSISFVAEYYYTQKPLLFTVRDETIQSKFNAFGKEVFKHIYKSRSQEDIIEYIDNVVLGGRDSLYSQRKEFYETILCKDNVSENILRELENELGIN